MAYCLWFVNITAEKQRAAERARKLQNSKDATSLVEEVFLLEQPDASYQRQDSDAVGKMKKSGSGEDSNSKPTSPTTGNNDILFADIVKEKVCAVNKAITLRGKKKSKRHLIHRDKRPTLIYDRPDLDPVYMPFGFIIVVTFTVIILVSVSFAVLYLLNQITFAFNKVLVYLPSISANASIEAANSEIVNILCAGIALAVQKFPELGSLMNLIPRLRSINVVTYLSDIRDNMSKILLGIELLFIVAGVISVLTVLASLFFTSRKIPQLIREIRRGRLKLPDSARKLTLVEGHIGLHVMLLIILQALTFVVVVVVGVVCALPVVQDFVKNNWLVLAATFGTSTLSQRATEYFVVERFLTDRSFVIRHEGYAVWHFVALVLGVFTGIVAGITRWVTAVGVLTFTFASVEMSVMPSSFATMDKAHVGFLCAVMAEAVNGNPLMLVFCSLLLTTRELRLQAIEKSRSSSPEADVESFMLDASKRTSATVLNISRLLVRRIASTRLNSMSLSEEPQVAAVPLDDYIEDVAWRRREKVRQRFWLWWILTKNPSLRLDRKHQLEYIVEGGEDDCGGGEDRKAHN